jgi:hypothetical protein
MDHEGSSSPSWNFRRLSVSREPSVGSASHPHMSGLHLPRINMMPPPQPRRFAGDGLDFRRPVSLSRNDDSPVIDLTSDDAGPSPSAPNFRPQHVPLQRLPRFQRNIIDISEEVPRPNAPPESPEIQFISARRLDDRPPHDHRDNDVEYVRGGDNEVEFVRSIPLPEQRRAQDVGAGHHRFEHIMAGMFEDILRDDHNSLAYLQARLHRSVNNLPPVVPPRRARRAHHVHVGLAMPLMDYEIPGFDMGIEEPREPPPPTYKGPSPAPDGFTRSPNEEDPLICPNCEDELCVGESDLKKQVWIIKGCGHVSQYFAFVSPYTNDCDRHTAASALQIATSRRAPKGKKEQPWSIISLSRNVSSMAAARRRADRKP